MREGVMTSNVASLHSVKAEMMAEREKEVNNFDDLFADYLVARAELIRSEPPDLDPGTSNEINERQCERVYDAFWKLARTPAPQKRHVELKFQALFAEIEDDGLYRPYWAMLESIRTDVEGL